MNAPIYRPVVSRPAANPLLVPAWILAACAVLLTLMAAVWFLRAERALGAAQDAVREMERREATRELSPDDDLTRRLRDK